VKKGLFLAFLVLVIGFAIYDYQSTEKSKVIEELQTVIVPMKANQIQNLVIEKKGELPMEFQKDEKGWMMVRPQKDVANESRLAEVIEGIVTEKSMSKVEDTGKFGLNPPLGSFTLINNLEEKVTVDVGSIKNFEGNAYLKKNGAHEILVGSSTWFAKLERPANEYRDMRLLRSSTNGLSKISLSTGKGSLSLVNKDAQWILTQKPKLKLDQNRIREIVSMLTTTEGLEIVSETKPTATEMKEWGFLNPDLKMTLERDGKKPWSIAFATKNKISRAMTSEPEWVLKVLPTDARKFGQDTSVDELRDRGEPFDFDKSKVSKLTVKVNGQVQSPAADTEAFRTIVSRLYTMKIDKFKPILPKGYQFMNEVLLEDSAGQALIRFSYGKPLLPQKNEASRVIAKSSLYPEPFSVLEGDLETMNLDQTKKEPK
jgi:hypothetical protein